MSNHKHRPHWRYWGAILGKKVTIFYPFTPLGKIQCDQRTCNLAAAMSKETGEVIGYEVRCGDPDRKNCGVCGKPLDQPDDDRTRNCGGDCVACMAAAGDPDCIKAMQEIDQKRRGKKWRNRAIGRAKELSEAHIVKNYLDPKER